MKIVRGLVRSTRARRLGRDAHFFNLLWPKISKFDVMVICLTHPWNPVLTTHKIYRRLRQLLGSGRVHHVAANMAQK